jgi:hypothetical protein
MLTGVDLGIDELEHDSPTPTGHVPEHDTPRRCLLLAPAAADSGVRWWNDAGQSPFAPRRPGTGRGWPPMEARERAHRNQNPARFCELSTWRGLSYNTAGVAVWASEHGPSPSSREVTRPPSPGSHGVLFAMQHRDVWKGRVVRALRRLRE